MLTSREESMQTFTIQTRL